MPKGPWIGIAPPEEATGDLKRAYERIRTTRGRIPHIRSVMAGEPLVVEGFAFFFPENNYACASIDRRLAEMIATVASVANGSGFGAPAHARQLAKLTATRRSPTAVMSDYGSAGISGKERVLLDYVWKLSGRRGK
jgi:AhpD family alkylhydroperoxidase